MYLDPDRPLLITSYSRPEHHPVWISVNHPRISADFGAVRNK